MAHGKQILGQIRRVQIDKIDGPNSDAFGRFRISAPETVFDSKMIHTPLTSIWDDQEVSGSGTSSVHDPNRASMVLSVSDTTAGKRVRQTYARPNYQPAKSQLIMMTGILGAGGPGNVCELGAFDDKNGVFFRQNGGTVEVVVRSFVTGTAVDSAVSQNSWGEDRLNGEGESGITVDWSMSQIFLMDFEWLGVGTVRFGLVLEGEIVYIHHFHHANIKPSVYMSTPNNPLRYSIENDGSGVAASMEQMCSAVMSEGGQQTRGIDHYYSNGGTHVDCNSADTVYALLGVKLQEGHQGEPVEIDNISVLTETNDDYEWLIIRNPNVAGTFTYSCVASGPFMIAKGTTANTATDGMPIAGGYGSSGSITSETIDYEGSFGEAIDGTRDEYVLVARPLGSNADISGGIQLHVAH